MKVESTKESTDVKKSQEQAQKKSKSSQWVAKNDGVKSKDAKAQTDQPKANSLVSKVKKKI